MRVLFVAGTGRSGSTLVGNLLGSLPGATSVGELRYLWERGLREAAPCGCGLPVPQCPFWQDVLARAYAAQPPDPEAIVEVEQRLLRMRGLARLLRAHGRPEELGAAATWYAAELASVYRAVADASGGSVVVDASKLVSYGYLLGHADGLDVRVLHLVRDPRGVAHSWRRVRERADRGDGEPAMGRESVLRSPVVWDAWNVLAERLWSADPSRYVRVRYEDAVTDPIRALAPAIAMVGLDPAALPVDADGTAHLVVSHTVAGNPVRMTSGAVRLRPDDEWATAMPGPHRAVVTAATAPLLPRYGYPLLLAGRAVGGTHAGAADTGPRTFVEDMHGWRRLEARVSAQRRVGPQRGTAPRARGEGGRPAAHRAGRGPQVAVPARAPTQRGALRCRCTSSASALGHEHARARAGMAPEVEVHNEDDRRAFDRYKLRSDAVVESLVARSPHSHVLFKPLCDSHRVDHLLDDIHTARPGRAVWVYRDVDGRVRSALAKFGDGNLQVLREFADGTDTTRWHVAADVVLDDRAGPLVRLRRDDARVRCGADVARPQPALLGARARPATGRAPGVLQRVPRRPAGTMRRLCAFLGLPLATRRWSATSPRGRRC